MLQVAALLPTDWGQRSPRLTLPHSLLSTAPLRSVWDSIDAGAAANTACTLLVLRGAPAAARLQPRSLPSREGTWPPERAARYTRLTLPTAPLAANTPMEHANESIMSRDTPQRTGCSRPPAPNGQRSPVRESSHPTAHQLQPPARPEWSAVTGQREQPSNSQLRHRGKREAILWS